MKSNLTMFLALISFLALAPISFAGGVRNNIDPNPNFQRIMKSVTRIVIRDGGDICCVSKADTLKQKVFVEITAKEEIADFAEHIVFKKGTSINECFCCGRPGLDLYAGKKRVFFSGIKHGSGLMKEAAYRLVHPEIQAMVTRMADQPRLTRRPN